MQVQVQDLGQLKRSITVVIPTEEITPEYNKIMKAVKSTKVKGFRSGKFPKGYVDKKFIEFMEIHAKGKIVPEYYKKAIEQEKLIPAASGSLETLTFDNSKPMSFTVHFEVMPTVTPPDYCKINLEKKEITVSSEELETLYSMVLDQHSKMENLPDDAVVEMGHVLNVDYLVTVEGKSIKDGKQENILVEIGKKGTIPGFDSNLLGLKKGEKKDFTLALPESENDEFSGKEARFEVEIKKISQKNMPELNYEFFSLFPGVENEEEFRNFLKRTLIKEKQFNLKNQYHNELKKRICELYKDVDIPQSLMDEVTNNYSKQVKKEKPLISEDELNSLISEYRNNAENEFIYQSAINSISSAESIVVDQKLLTKEVQMKANQLSKYTSDKVEDILKSDLGQEIYRNCLTNLSEVSVLDFIIEKALGSEEARKLGIAPVKSKQTSENTNQEENDNSQEKIEESA